MKESQKKASKTTATKIEVQPTCQIPETHCWKYVFWGIAALIMILMTLNVRTIGHGGDDLWYLAHSKFALNYYIDKDTTVFDYSNVSDYHVNLVPQLSGSGTGADIIPAAISRFFHVDNILLVKKYWLAIVGFLLMLFTGLIGVEIKNYKLGILAMMTMCLTPNIFGLSFCGGQDISSAMGFALAIYGFIVLTKAFPNISAVGVICSFLGTMFATSVRVSGLMLLMYFFVLVVLEFVVRKELRQLIPQKQYFTIIKILGVCLLIGISAVLIGLCAYPSVFHNGLITHVKDSFSTVSKYAHRIPFIYEGRMVESTNLPEHYLLLSLLRTLPYYILRKYRIFP